MLSRRCIAEGRFEDYWRHDTSYQIRVSFLCDVYVKDEIAAVTEGSVDDTLSAPDVQFSRAHLSATIRWLHSRMHCGGWRGFESPALGGVVGFGGLISPDREFDASDYRIRPRPSLLANRKMRESETPRVRAVPESLIGNSIASVLEG